MNIIYKYMLPLSAVTTIKLPDSFSVVLVGEQQGAVYVWIEMDAESKVSDYSFHVFGTGQPIPSNYQHLGSVIINPFVWHVYYGWKENDES
jgi:hypothetical protein